MARDVLTKAEAAVRSTAIGDLHYSIDLRLAEEAGDHRGATTASFTMHPDPPTDLWMDYAGEGVESVMLDGRPLPIDWDGARLRLPSIRPGRHSIDITHRIDPGHAGTSHFVDYLDPVDGSRYLSTAFEPFGAHRVFPCFDQPDLRATFSCSVEAPSHWTVIGNGPARSEPAVREGWCRTSIAPVGPISPYLVAVMAGTFSQVHRRIGALPVSYAARASRAATLDAEVEAIHAVVEASVEVLTTYLGQPMPFPKLDLVFVPGLDDGAMENVGAIAFDESFLLGPGASASQRAGRAEIVAHEVAHMWIGNLVSIGWWEDLWLKESLATYLSFIVLESASLTPDPWVLFEAGRKAEALDDDRRTTGHPVVGAVPDTDAALVAGDDIAYGKGAAVLHQLAAHLGADTFVTGLRTFLTTHAWGSASLADLVCALEGASGRDLGAWSKAWLQCGGADTLVTSVDRGLGTATVSVRRTDTAAQECGRRTHHLDVTVGWLSGVEWRTERHPTVVDDTATVTLPDVTGPVVVLPDGSGHAYAQVLLEPESALAARQLVGSISDPLHRQLVWSSLWELVRVGRLPTVEFVDDALNAATDEPSDAITAALLVHVRTALTRWLPVDCWRVQSRAVELGLEMARRPGATLARPWLRLAAEAAASPDDVRRVGWVLWGDGASSEVLTPSLAWAVVTTAAAHGLSETDAWASATALGDPDGAAQGMAALEAARPDAETKARVWQQVVSSVEAVRPSESTLKNFFRPEQTSLVAPYVERFFETAENVAPTWPIDRALTFVTAAFPDLPELTAIPARAKAAVGLLRQTCPTLARPLADAAEDLALAVRLRSLTRA